MKRSSLLPLQASTARAAELEEVCRAIIGLPDECRKSLVFKKVYRRSCEEIASDCNVPVDTARAQVIKGFKLLQASL